MHMQAIQPSISPNQTPPHLCSMSWALLTQWPGGGRISVPVSRFCAWQCGVVQHQEVNNMSAATHAHMHMHMGRTWQSENG